MTNYGDTSSKVMLSTAFTDADGGAVTAGAEIPSGDILYLIAVDVEFPRKNELKKTKIAGGTSVAPSLGKRDWSVKLTNVYPIIHDSITTQDEAFNEIKDYLDLVCKSGATGKYLFIQSAQGNYIHLGHNGTIGLHYMRVKPVDYTSKNEGGIWMFSSISFIEVTSG